MSRFANTIFGYLDEVKNAINLRPLYLGGFSGDEGGSGGPPGGFQGYLPQTRVAYDITEAEVTGFLSGNPYNSSGVLVSATLLDNLNHIRYRLSILEGSGIAGLVGIYVYDDGALVDTDITILDFGTGLDVSQTDYNRVLITASGTSTVDVLNDLSDVNAPSPNDGDSLVWDNGTSKWIPVAVSGGGGASALDDLTDVDAPAPSTGNVLVFDGANWINSTVSGFVTVLDDLTDVNVPSPNDGEVLTWDDGTNMWIPSVVATSGGGGGSTSTYTGIYSSRPSAATTSGGIFFPTDAPVIERSTGSEWQPWGPIVQFTHPNLSEFSWLNQGSATATEQKGGILVTAPTVSPADYNWRMLYKAQPSTPYSITATFYMIGRPVLQAGAGLFWRESSSGALVVSALTYDYGLTLYIYKYTDETTYNSYYTDLDNYEIQMYAGYNFVTTMKIEDDGTYRNIYMSPDGGLNFVLIHQISNTDYITADQVGFCVDSESTTYPLSAKLLSWKEE